MERTCFYHAGCPDGFGAAWAARRAWGERARYLARGHDDAVEPGACEGQLVVFADLAPPNEALRALGEVTARVVVLDHHVSARDRFYSDPSLDEELRAGGHLVVFDLEHSGAMLAWQHFHPGEPAPDLLRYVEDQDLWNWKLPRSEEVNAAIGSYAQAFDTWDELAARPVAELAEEGTPLVRSQRAEVERSLQAAHPVALGVERAEAVNARHLRAPIGHELAKRAAYGKPWGVVYRVCGARVDVSIYSIGDLDVSQLARSRGGGGHRNASGFSVSLRTWLEEFV